MKKELDILYKHIFADPRFGCLSKGDRNMVCLCVEYFITNFLSHIPLLFLYYFKKLAHFELPHRFIYKYLFIMALLQLCCKWAEDEYYSNKSILNLFYNKNECAFFTQIELKIFQALDYNLYVSKETYDAFVEQEMKD